MQWQPLANHAALQQRAIMNQTIRQFFAERSVLEVETPLLGDAGVTDPHIESIRAGQQYLQTSPEYFMKRLLAAGSGDIYQLGKVFRKEEIGRFHHTEFTLLEWYRLGFGQWELIKEVEQLIEQLLGPQQFSYISYRELFEQYLGINPFAVSCEEVAQLAQQHIEIQMSDATKDDWLNLLLSHLLEPKLKQHGAVFLYAYPPSQAVLANTVVDQHGDLVAERFELYIQGLELANGFHELTDAEQQLQRFEADNALRVSMGLPTVAIDYRLIDALNAGLPACSGVALGIDRILMLKQQANAIDEVLTFRG